MTVKYQLIEKRMAMCNEGYFRKRMAEHDEETARSLLQNGASVGSVRKSISILSTDILKELNEEFPVTVK